MPHPDAAQYDEFWHEAEDDMRTQHNHRTRDIKPEGQCPGCDEYYVAIEKKQQGESKLRGAKEQHLDDENRPRSSAERPAPQWDDDSAYGS